MQIADDSGLCVRHGYCPHHGVGIDPSPFPLLLHTTKELSMAQVKSTRTHARASAPGEYDPDSGRVDSGGGKEPRGGHFDENIDEETGARSKRSGGTGDVSFGNDDEGPEGPAR
jgi:hypothetical protein